MSKISGIRQSKIYKSPLVVEGLISYLAFILLIVIYLILTCVLIHSLKNWYSTMFF